MAKYKIPILVVSFLLVIGISSSILYEVEVDESLNHSVYEVDHKNRIDNLQEFNVVLENTGSVGCRFGLVNHMYSENYSKTEYSEKVPLWPGESVKLIQHSVLENITGTVKSNLSLEYCGSQKSLGELKFNVSKKTYLNDTVDSETISSTEETVTFRTGVDKALAVPVGSPPYWKIGSSNITGGKTQSNLEAPIYSKSKKIEFALLNHSTEEVIGVTEVELKPEKNIFRKLMRNKLKVLLSISVFLNLFFMAVIGRKLRASN